MNIEVFDVARPAEARAARWISIQPNYASGERLGVFRLSENAVADYLWNSGGSDGYNRFARGHRFQKDDSEAFLQTGQTKYICTIVFLRQPGEGYIAEPMHDSI
jgi:hypothetical protein